MFVEVKGPGDRLQENQKVRFPHSIYTPIAHISMSYQVWMDVLVRADVPVEVCHVQDKNEPEKPQKVKKPKKRARDSDSERRNEPESEDEGPSTKRHALKRQKLHTPSPPEKATRSGSPEV
jgi:Fanconi-associated nuclease 1